MVKKEVKMRKRFWIFLLLGSNILIPHCAPNREILGNKSFAYYRYDEALSQYQELVEEKYRKRDISYIIYLLNFALINHYAGYWDKARESFWAAYKIDEGKLSEVAKGVEWIRAGEKRVYRLTKREKALLHFYLGTDYLYTGEIEKAIIEYKKIHLLEEQKPKLPLVCFYMGKAYEMLKKYDDALIEYKALENLTQKEKVFFPVYIELAKIYALKGDKENTLRCIEEFTALASPAQASLFKKATFPQEHQELILQIDQDRIGSLDSCKILVDGAYIGKAELIDVFQPGVTVEEYVRKFVKETASYAARKTARKGIIYLFEKLLPGVGDIIGDVVAEEMLGEEATKRSWYYAPDGFYLFVGYIPNQAQKIKIEFYRKGKVFETKEYNLNKRPVVKMKNKLFLTVRFQSVIYGKLPK